MKSLLSPAFANYPNIDWVLLAKSVAHFQALSYKQVEVPWAVPEQYSSPTRPHCDQSFVLDNAMFESQPHELVGSAEQGFCYLLATGNLEPGKYCSISPCFRVDDFDALHLPWFMKLELCHILDETEDASAELCSMLNQCAAWYDRNGGTCEVVAIDDTFDLNVNGIEVGSYGVRTVGATRYIYGTGLALTRFTIAIKK